MVQSRKNTTERSLPCDQQASHPPEYVSGPPRSVSSINRARLRPGYSSQDNPLQRRREMMTSRLVACNFRSGSGQRGGTLGGGVVPMQCPTGPQTPLPTLFGRGPDCHSFPRVEVSTLEALEAASALTSLDFN